jgi:hypothetical protein
MVYIEEFERQRLRVHDAEDLRCFEDFYVNEARERKRQQYYNEMTGGGMGDYFREYDPSEQDGCGPLDFFRGLFRAVIPVLKPVGKHLMKQAIRTAVATVGDIAQGEHWKTAAKRRLADAGDEIVEQVQNKVQKMSGLGYGDMNYIDSNYYYGEPSNLKAIEYVPSTSGEHNKREAYEQQLFSLNPPPVREGCVSTPVRSALSKPKQWFNKVRKVVKKKRGRNKKQSKKQKGKGIEEQWL